MKRTALAAVFVAAFLAFALPSSAFASVSWSVSVSSFHQTLAPYGRWVVAGSYGEVWVPAGITNDWEPYWDGEWLWTDYGWTWVSYDPWGDIPCHYGTWARADPYGWVWEPGTVWAPAWVTWAWTDDYIGWAPVPATFGITISGYAGPAVTLPSTRYILVPATQFVGVNVQKARVRVTQNAVILRRAQKATRFTVSNGIVRTAGPSPSFVQRVSGKRIERVSIEKARTRPTSLAAAHVSSGKKISIVAPARERATALAQGKAKESKRSAKPSREATASQQRSSHAKARETRVNSSGRAAKPSREVRASKQPPASANAKAHEARSKPRKQNAKAAREEHASKGRSSTPEPNRSAKKRPTGTAARTHVTSPAREREKVAVKPTHVTSPAREQEKVAAKPIDTASKNMERPAPRTREEHRVANAAPQPHRAEAAPRSAPSTAAVPHGAPSGQSAKAPPPQQASKEKKKEKDRE